ncbi:hypothetical protein CRUP_013165, partial [Coryphaenoides rupestris]
CSLIFIVLLLLHPQPPRAPPPAHRSERRLWIYPASWEALLIRTMNKMKNFKRRFSLSVPRTETIEENEYTEQINQLNIRHTQGLDVHQDSLGLPSQEPSPVSPEAATPGSLSPSS